MAKQMNQIQAYGEPTGVKDNWLKRIKDARMGNYHNQSDYIIAKKIKNNTIF